MEFEIPDLDQAEEAAQQTVHTSARGTAALAPPVAVTSVTNQGRSTDGGSLPHAQSVLYSAPIASRGSDGSSGAGAASSGPGGSAAASHSALGQGASAPSGLSELPESHVARQSKGPAVADPTRILVSPRQRGNPLLGLVRNVPWRFEERCRADYELGRGVGALYLSLRYHLRYPKYVRVRMRDVHGYYTLRVLLILSDIDDPARPLSEVCREACQDGFTAIVAWSPAEAARYLETFKAYEKKSAKHIQPQRDQTAGQAIASALTSVRGVNSTDVVTLTSGVPRGAGDIPGSPAPVAAAAASAGQHRRPGPATFADILRCPAPQLRALPGLGDTKVDRLLAAVTRPLRPGQPPDPVRRHRLGLPVVGASGLPERGPASATAAAVQASGRARGSAGAGAGGSSLAELVRRGAGGGAAAEERSGDGVNVLDLLGEDDDEEEGESGGGDSEIGSEGAEGATVGAVATAGGDGGTAPPSAVAKGSGGGSESGAGADALSRDGSGGESQDSD